MNTRPDSDRGGWHVSARDLLALVVMLPPLVYGSGYFLWIGASSQLYGFNVAPLLGVKSLIEPGALYVGTLILAGAIAAVVGLQRLAPRGRFRRPLAVGLAVLFWLGIIIVLSVVGQGFASGRSVFPILGPGESTLCFLALLVIMSDAVRRTVGVLRSRLAPPRPDPRRDSAAARLSHGLLLFLLALVHVHAPLVFGVVGPNPALRLTPVTITLEGRDAAPWELFLIEKNSERVLGYDPDKDQLVEIPAGQVKTMAQPRFSSRQEAFLRLLREQGEAGREIIDRCFPIREMLKRMEISDLERRGRIHRESAGRYRLP